MTTVLEILAGLAFGVTYSWVANRLMHPNGRGLVPALRAKRRGEIFFLLTWMVAGGMSVALYHDGHHALRLLVVVAALVWVTHLGHRIRKANRLLGNPLIYLIMIQDEFGVPAPLPEPICPIQNIQSYDHIDNGLLDSQQEEES